MMTAASPRLHASAEPPEGALDGWTIVRFAHAFASGGGMERILADLDTIVLQRNAATVVRMYIASNDTETETVIEPCGRGRLVLVPLPLAPGDSRQLASDHEPTGLSWREVLRNRVIYNPLVWALGGRAYTANRRIRRRKGEVVGAGRRFAEICRRYPVDLCVMHFFGTADSEEIIEESRRRGIPVALENHYANERFLHLSIRKHAMSADGVAGMNALDVPSYLTDGFTNLADGIDMSCFDPRRTNPVPAPAKPLIFLPSRIVRPKGQLDVVRAAARLRDRGHPVAVAFAGRVDSEAFMAELRGEIENLRLQDDVHFLGELSATALRDWYAAAAVLAFPTYHHEGLGRIIIEAQAMECPVVAYGTGGVREGVLDGKSGWLVPTGDLEQLTHRLEALVADPELRRRMGRAGREFVLETYSLEALAERHERYYRDVVARAKGSAVRATT